MSAPARPETLYRKHVEMCHLPENEHTFDFMSDYLTMMDILAKAITHGLEEACRITPLQYRIMIRMLADSDMHTKSLSADLHVGVSTVSVAVSKLANKKLISRSESATDMRLVGLNLTDAGRALVAKADLAVYTIMTEYWNTLTREQLEAAMTSSISAVERYSHMRYENGEPRIDTAFVDTVMISRMLTAQALQEHGMTAADYRVLLALKIMGGRSFSADIAKFLFLNSSDLTSCIKNLEAMGLITRQRMEENRRIRVIELTSKGDARTIELLPIVFDALHETCHSSDELIRIHVSAARDLVARKRHRGDF